MVLERLPVDADDFDGPVLVTGAGGCIGSWALALLVRAGVSVVAFDLTDDRRRPRLLMDEAELDRITWETGDIADTDTVAGRVRRHDIRAIIHLATLQVPFCKADPVGGAKANVIGTVNVFEAARHNGVKRFAYASSIAALSMYPGAPWAPTLYGAYKACDEMVARVYFEDWGIPSVGLRPGVVYGVGRDQGLTSKTTIAILAAAAGRPYTVPFSGPVSALVRSDLRPDDVVLVKGRSAQRLDRVALALQGRTVGCEIDHCRVGFVRCDRCPKLEAGWATRYRSA